jgi:uncharacterized membrane protein
MATPKKQNRIVTAYKIHWHVLFVHFPISLFGVAFGFQILHLFIEPRCFEIATNVTLIGAAVMMIPTTWTGWFTWKRDYKGAKIKLFKRKIGTSFAMLALSIPLVTWRIMFLGLFEEAPDSPAHWIYLAGNTLLILGAVAEGYYGGRLHHR